MQIKATFLAKLKLLKIMGKKQNLVKKFQYFLEGNSERIFREYIRKNKESKIELERC